MTPYLEQLTGGPFNGEVCDGREVYRQAGRQTGRQAVSQTDTHTM